MTCSRTWKEISKVPKKSLSPCVQMHPVTRQLSVCKIMGVNNTFPRSLFLVRVDH